jgi:hypothetical protein
MLVFGKGVPDDVGVMCRGVFGRLIPVEMRCCETELVPAMDTAEVINLFEMTVSDFDADCVEEKTGGAYAEPDVIKGEEGEDFNPEFCRESWETDC